MRIVEAGTATAEPCSSSILERGIEEIVGNGAMASNISQVGEQSRGIHDVPLETLLSRHEKRADGVGSYF